MRPRGIVKLFGIVATAPLAVLLILFVWYVVTYDDELVAIRATLDAIPDVTLLESGGNEDLTLEDIYATIEVAGKGVLELRNLTLESFKSVDRLDVAAAGGLEPRISGCGFVGVVVTATREPIRTLFWSDTINVGPSGDFAPRLRGGITSIQELVSRFDEVVELLRSFPDCPNGHSHRDSEGTVRYYSVAPAGSRCWPKSRFPAVEESKGRC